MYNWVTRRKIERTDRPQQVFTTVVDSVVRTWMPAIALVASSCVTPSARKLDVRTYDWSASPASWIQATLPTGPTTAQQSPAHLGPRSFRTDARKALDVRAYEWAPADDWIQTVTATVPVHVAPTAETASFRTADRSRLDVRSYEWAPSSAGWDSVNHVTPPTAAQIWPAIVETANFRTPAKTFRDLRYHDATPLFGVPDDPFTFDGAIFSDDGGRTAERPRLDVRRYEWSNGLGWIVATFPVTATQAQVWPAILAGSQPNYRTADRAKLDLRAYEWAPADDWMVPLANGLQAPFAAVFTSEAASFRTVRGAVLDVRSSALVPDAAWIATVQAPAASTAQLWPAVLETLSSSGRTAARARLDVRLYEWAPEPAWIKAVVDAVVAKWTPVFGSEAASFRTGDHAQIDVRSLPFSSAPAGVLATNRAPVVDAGSDIAITLPDTASLSGLVTDDGLPVAAVVTTLWTTISGPSTVVYASATSASTTATFDTAGTYVLRLTASDTLLSAFDELTVTVAAAPVPVCDSIVAQVSADTGDSTVAQDGTATGDEVVSQ